MATSSPPAPSTHPKARPSMRATSTPPIAPLRRSLPVLKKLDNPKPEPKPEPKTRRAHKTRRKAPSGRRQRVKTSTPAVPSTPDAIKNQPLVLHDDTGDATHLRSPQNHLKRPARGESETRSADVLFESEPNEDLGCVSVTPPGTTPKSRELLGNAGADNPERPRVVGPCTAMSIARRLLGGVQANNVPRPSIPRENTVHEWSSPYSMDTTSQLHVPSDVAEDSTYRRTSQHHLSWLARHRRGGTRSRGPEAVIKTKLENELTNSVNHATNAAPTSQLPLGNTRADLSKPTSTTEYRDEIVYLPEVDPSLNRGVLLSRDGKTEIPLFVVPRRELTNTDITEAPSASPNHPSVPSLSTVTRQTYTTDCFNSMFPWAKYSVELNRRANIPWIPPPPTVHSEAETEEEDFATTDEEDELERESASECAETSKGVKRTRDETFDDDDESVVDEDEEEPRPQRRRKLLWA